MSLDPKRWRPAADLGATEFKDAILSLTDLFRASLRAGESVIRGKRFENCRIEGPAVLLALGVELHGCDMGYSHGDVRSLLLRPMSPQRVVGAVPMAECKFVDCSFFAVGFTGSEAFLDEMLKIDLTPAPDRSA